MPCTLVAASSFASGRAYLSLNFLPPLSLSSLDPYSDYRGVNIFKQLLALINVYIPPICSSPTDGSTESFFLSILPSSRNLFILGGLQLPSHPLGLKRYFCPHGGNYLTGSSLLTSFSSMTLTYLLFYIAPLAVAPPPDNSFALFSLTLSCSWEVLQDLGSDHLPIFLSVLFSSVFVPMSVPHLSIFRKSAWMALPSTLILTVLLQRNTCLFLFPLLLLSLPLWH